MKKYAIIGFGGMGKTHFMHLRKLEQLGKDIKLAAICNSDIESISKNVSLNFGDANISDIDFSQYGLYTDYKEMIEKEEIDFVLISLPNYLHSEVSVYCLERGIDVFVEKPMAITLDECTAMMEASKKGNSKLMVGQAVRFVEQYSFLKDAVEDGRYGKVVKAAFSRKSFLPAWSYENWMLKDDKSGGCLVDMHVHDIDMMVWLFGKPQDMSVLSTHKMSDFESAFGLYQYPEHVVSVVGDWGHHAKTPFEAEYSVTFENAHLDFKNNKLMVYTNDSAEEIAFEGKDPHYEELVEFVDAILSGEDFKTVKTQSVYETMEVLFAAKEMARSRKK